jgi:hypothetical protein
MAVVSVALDDFDVSLSDEQKAQLVSCAVRLHRL